MSTIRDIIPDRIQLNSVLIVLCFVSVLLLESQSAASWPTYLLALSVLLSVRQWNDVFKVRLFWVISALLLYLASSSFWSTPFEWRNVGTAFSRALLVFCFVVAFAECQLRGELRRWLGRALAVVGLIAVLAALWVHVQDPPEHGRLNGLGQLDTQVIAALVYGVVLIFVLDVVVSDRSLPWRVVAGISALIIAYAVFLSDSRNAWVSVVIGVGVFLLAQWVLSAQRFIAAVIAMGLVLSVVILALIVNEDTHEWILPRGDSYRPDIWAASLAKIVDGGVWFGLGIATNDDVLVDGLVFNHPHNLYLSVWQQGGLMALMVLAVLIGALLRVVTNRFDHQDAKQALGILGLALPAYLLDGHELIDKVGSTWFLFWLPVAVALGFEWRRHLQGAWRL